MKLTHRPRLLLLTADSGPGGTMSWVGNILPHLELQFDVMCVLRSPARGIEEPAIPTENILHAPLLSPGKLFGAGILARALDNFRPNAILISGFTGLLPMLILRRFRGYRNIPVLMVQRGVLNEFPHISQWKISLAARLARLALTSRDQVAAVAPNVKDYLKSAGFGSHSIALIPNGVDVAEGLVERRSSASNRVLRVAFIGRLSIEKGADRLPELARLGRRRPIELHIAGSGDMESTLRQAMREDIEQGRVILHGWLDEPANLLRNMDLLILTSRTEACPHAALEAFALDVPVWALAVGGLPYILDEGRAGRLFDDFNEFSRAYAILDHAALTAMKPQRAHATHLLQERYSLAAMVNNYTRRLQRLMAQSP